VAGDSVMAIEDYTTYTEVDPNNHISCDADTVTVTGLTRNEIAYKVKDRGVNHFNGNFDHLLEQRVTAGNNGGVTRFWVLGNALGAANDIDVANGDQFEVWFFVDLAVPYYIGLTELDGGTIYNATWQGVALNTTYYLRIKRDEAIGVHGTLYCDIYANAADRANEINALANLSLTLNTNKKDFRYIYAVQASNDGNAATINAYTENLDLQEGWTGKFCGVTNPGKINGVSVANIAKVNGVASS